MLQIAFKTNYLQYDLKHHKEVDVISTNKKKKIGLLPPL